MIKKYFTIFALITIYCSLELAAMDHIGDFEKKLMQPDTEQVMERASTVAPQYKLSIKWLQEHYRILQYWAIRIANIANVKERVEFRPKTTAALNPDIGQLEPGECIGVEFHRGLPSGFWSALGYFPIGECGAIYDENTLAEIIAVLTNFLGLKKVKDLSPYSSLWRGSLDYNPLNRGQSPALNERKRTIPYNHAEDLWRAVKPEERAGYY